MWNHCNVSYKTYVGTAANAKNVNIIGNGTVNLNCTKAYVAMFTLDVSGLNYTLSNLNFLLGGTAVRGIEAVLYSTSNSFTIAVSQEIVHASKGGAIAFVGTN
jgi:hypothetical protein